jgi:hypothetical protein
MTQEARRGRLEYPDANTERAITAVEQAWREKFNSALSDSGLRKWCVERALQAPCLSGDVVRLANEIYSFVTAPVQIPPDEPGQHPGG